MPKGRRVKRVSARTRKGSHQGEDLPAASASGAAIVSMAVEAIKTPVFLIVALLVVVPTIGFIYVSGSHEASNRYFNGFDIRSDCRDDIEGIFAARPDFDSGVIQVSIAIKDYKTKSERCSRIQFVIPGFGVNFRTVPTPESLSRNRSALPAEPAKPVGKVFFHSLGYQTFEIDTQIDAGFAGDIQFDWPGGIYSKSFAEQKIVIPFASAEEAGERNLMNTAKSFRVSMPVRDGKFALKEKSHEIFGRRSMGDMYFYYFDVDRKNQVLELLFEDVGRAPWKDRLQNLFAAIFGAGLGLVCERTLRFFGSGRRKARAQ